MNPDQIRRQSESAYKQWCEQWRKQAVENGKHEQHSFEDFRDSGFGKAALCVANGYSFEENIETIKKHKDNVDIICCDKTMGHLLDNGITPKIVVVCDANVDYERYMHKYADKLHNTYLFMNICGNPKWADNGNWKKKFFFVNKDVLQSEEEFSKLSGCKNIIIAGTNVSNAMIILLTQCENQQRNNFFGYDKIILIGFDYSWKLHGNYYAFDKDAAGKDKYMAQMFFYADDGTPIYSSGNLFFSKKWIQEYIHTFHLPVVQCGKHSLLQIGTAKDLAYQMSYTGDRPKAKIIRALKDEREKLVKNLNNINYTINDLSKRQFTSFLKSI